MYLCGYTMSQLLGREVPKRLMEKGINLSFEFAMCGMMELKDASSAMLVYGTSKANPEPHAWVEYNTDPKKSGTRMVRDYCSDFMEIPFLKHQNTFFPDTERVYLDYFFWTKFMNHLYELVQSPDTSFVLGALCIMHPKFKNGKIYGITDFGFKHSVMVTGEEFIPTVIKNPDGSYALLTRETIDSLMH